MNNSSETIASIRQQLKQNNESLNNEFLKGAEIGSLLIKRSKAIDNILIALWREMGNSAALIAVGGYGRQEMHPASDIDILLLLDEEPDEKTAETLSDFVTLLWDLGLDIGHSVRTVEECINEASNDLTIITNLIESRFICGNERLFKQLTEQIAADKLWSSREFLLAKEKEQAQRYRQYGDTAYRVEPNLKDGPGGLRDLQTIGWIALREFGIHTFRELSHYDLLNPQEYEALIGARDFLWKVRFALHQKTGRKEDRLLFDYQRDLAHLFGYTNDEKNASIEAFMQQYYRTITKLERLNEMLLGLLREHILQSRKSPPVTINALYQHIDGYLELTDPDLFQQQPHTLLELFHVMQTHPEIKGLTPVTLRELKRQLRLIDREYRENPRHKQIFMAIMSAERRIAFALRRMNRYGVLAAYLPAFESIVGRMQYDLFHAYTVDDHTINVIRNMRHMSSSIAEQELFLCSELFNSLDKPSLLYLSGLFHDIAKGRGGDHSELGAIDAYNFCIAHDLSNKEAKLVSWLVENHLIMSTTAQRKDISDPEVVELFTNQMPSQKHLDYLYLLTICDIKGTNPTLLTSWKHSLLQELYQSSRRQIQSRQSAYDKKQQLIEEKTIAIREQLLEQGVSPEQINAFWERLTSRYILQHHVKYLVWQILEVIQFQKEEPFQLDNNTPLIRIVPDENNKSSRLFIYARNREDLFMKITSALEQHHMNIVAARISLSKDCYILDTFYLLNADNKILIRQDDMQQLIDTLQKRLASSDVAYDFSHQMTPRQLRHFDTPTKVKFERDDRHQHTIITITTADRPGLLTRIAEVFYQLGLSIFDAKISTLGESAEDIFHVTDNNGKMINDAAQQESIRKTIEEKLKQD